MPSIFCAFLFSCWFLLSWYLLFTPKLSHKEYPYGFTFKHKMLSLGDMSHEVEIKKGTLLKGEFLTLFLCSAVLSAMAAYLTKNVFVLIIGLVIGFYVPGFYLEKKRRAKRTVLLSKITEALRLFLSHLSDQNNITRTMEKTRNESIDLTIKVLLNSYISDVAVGASIQDALNNMRKKVNLKKFDMFIDNLIQAHYEGISKEAYQALEKTVEAMEFDLRAIDKVREKSRNKKKKLYMTLFTTWLFPPLLSMVNTGNRNVFFNTYQGKLLIVMYFIGSIYVYVKGEEFLSLNLEEF